MFEKLLKKLFKRNETQDVEHIEGCFVNSQPGYPYQRADYNKNLQEVLKRMPQEVSTEEEKGQEIIKEYLNLKRLGYTDEEALLKTGLMKW